MEVLAEKGLKGSATKGWIGWAIVWGCLTFAAGAQQGGQGAQTFAPSEQGGAVVSGQMVSGQVAGVIFGSVSDSDGALVPGAQVVLHCSGEQRDRTTISHSDGRFSFSGVTPGAFEMTATAKGLAPGKLSGTLQPGQVFDAPAIRLGAATADTEVTVTPQTEHEIAEEEVRTEEKQRVLGIVPNFFVTYDPNPVPLSAKQKYGLGIRAVVDPVHFAFAAAAAGVEQEANTYPGFGTGPAAYGKRFGAALATSTTSSLLIHSVYPSLFHQDPRYFYKGTGTGWERAKYALSTAVIRKGDNGQWQPNYSTIAGSLTAGALSNLYYAPSDRHGAALTFENGLLSIAGEGVGHLVQEFVLRRFTTHSKGQAPPVQP